MSARLKSLVARREALMRQSGAQREQLATHATELRRGLWFVEATALGVRFAASRPLLVVAAAGTILVLVPPRLLQRGARVALVVLSAWRLGRSVRELLRAGPEKAGS
jgi:hypothetical protein